MEYFECNMAANWWYSIVKLGRKIDDIWLLSDDNCSDCQNDFPVIHGCILLMHHLLHLCFRGWNWNFYEVLQAICTRLPILNLLMPFHDAMKKKWLRMMHKIKARSIPKYCLCCNLWYKMAVFCFYRTIRRANFTLGSNKFLSICKINSLNQLIFLHMKKNGDIIWLENHVTVTANHHALSY